MSRRGRTLTTSTPVTGGSMIKSENSNPQTNRVYSGASVKWNIGTSSSSKSTIGAAVATKASNTVLELDPLISVGSPDDKKRKRKNYIQLRSREIKYLLCQLEFNRATLSTQRFDDITRFLANSDVNIVGSGINFFVVSNSMKSPCKELVLVISLSVVPEIISEVFTLIGMLKSTLGYSRVRRSAYVTSNKEVCCAPSAQVYGNEIGRFYRGSVSAIPSEFPRLETRQYDPMDEYPCGTGRFAKLSAIEQAIITDDDLLTGYTGAKPAFGSANTVDETVKKGYTGAQPAFGSASTVDETAMKGNTGTHSALGPANTVDVKVMKGSTGAQPAFGSASTVDETVTKGNTGTHSAFRPANTVDVKVMKGSTGAQPAFGFASTVDETVTKGLTDKDSAFHHVNTVDDQMTKMHNEGVAESSPKRLRSTDDFQELDALLAKVARTGDREDASTARALLMAHLERNKNTSNLHSKRPRERDVDCNVTVTDSPPAKMAKADHGKGAGKPLTTERFCQPCGTTTGGEFFCGHCGTKRCVAQSQPSRPIVTPRGPTTSLAQKRLVVVARKRTSTPPMDAEQDASRTPTRFSKRVVAFQRARGVVVTSDDENDVGEDDEDEETDDSCVSYSDDEDGAEVSANAKLPNRGTNRSIFSNKILGRSSGARK